MNKDIKVLQNQRNEKRYYFEMDVIDSRITIQPFCRIDGNRDRQTTLNLDRTA